ncbi:MAG: L-2-hydroxyglutarate oxidase [Candidatus Binatia bacterium]|nr:L-2-hydroxyglutarate oxidase [Candidatus Binatia bacterium]
MSDLGRYDIAVIGAGIVGLATARALQRLRPQDRILVLEKERTVAAHQTGHNSGVIHAGIYYKPGSLKAKLCVDGVRKMKAFCAEHGVAVDECGKVVVATNDTEVPRLEELFRRGQQNGVPGLRLIGPQELREIEPHASGVKAIHSPGTAIVDFAAVARAIRSEIESQGALVQLGARVVGGAVEQNEVVLDTTAGSCRARLVVSCAGLYADKVATLLGHKPDVQIVPFRGEYYRLRPDQQLVRALIYPVPDPRFPFLGVHFTKRINGEYEAGPNAVLAFAREGYRLRQVAWGELVEALRFPGFRHLLIRHWRTALGELYRSASKRAFCRALQKLVPEVRPEDLLPGGAGVRAQAVAADGRLVDDFSIVMAARVVHVLNAPSPAATASLAIGEYIAQRIATEYGWDMPNNAANPITAA